jgi:ATP-binding cassette, subfamily B, bacterial
VRLPPSDSRLKIAARARLIARFARLVWQVSPRHTLSITALRMAQAFAAPVLLWVGKLIFDLLQQVVAGRLAWQAAWERLLQLVVLELAVGVTAEALRRVSNYLESIFGAQVSHHLSLQLMRHAGTLDLRQFEDPSFHDRLERAQRETSGRVGLLLAILSTSQSAVTLCLLLGALVIYSCSGLS